MGFEGVENAKTMFYILKIIHVFMNTSELVTISKYSLSMTSKQLSYSINEKKMKEGFTFDMFFLRKHYAHLLNHKLLS